MSDDPVRIVGIGGSLRAGSRTLQLLDYAMRRMEAHGATVETIDLSDMDLPLFRAEAAEQPAEGLRLARAARQADGLLFATPVYHNTLSGAMKNALDYFELLKSDQPPYLSGRPVGLLAAGGGLNPILGVNTLEYVMRAMRAVIVWPMVAVPSVRQALDEQGRPLDGQLAARVDILCEEMVRYARLLRRAPVDA